MISDKGPLRTLAPLLRKPIRATAKRARGNAVQRRPLACLTLAILFSLRGGWGSQRGMGLRMYVGIGAAKKKQGVVRG